MPAQLEEEVELDLRGGIYSNESAYVIGQKPMIIKNGVWGWRYSQTDSGYTPPKLPPYFLRVPTYFPPRDPITFGSNPAMFLDIAFSFSSAASNLNKMIIGSDSANHLAAWRAETGGIFTFVAGVNATQTINLTTDPYPATSVYWPRPGFSGAHANLSATFFTHREASMLYVLFDNASAIESMQHLSITNVPTNIRSMAIHLDRLWMAQLRVGSALVSDIWYTDPFDAETIRGENFVGIDDVVTVITPSIPGQVDASGTPHLFVGCTNSIWMIDGDPITSQALTRQITSNIGIAGPLAIALSQYGVFFVGQDHQIYLCSTDGRQLMPIGEPVRDKINLIEFGSNSPGNRVSLAWFPPYLYYFPDGSPSTAYIADISDPSKPSWWGPVTSDAAYSTISIIKGNTNGAFIHATNASSRDTPAIYAAGKLSTSTGHFVGFDRFTHGLGTYPNGHEQTRQQSVGTGYFHKQGHKVELIRVTLETTAKASAYTWTVSGQYGDQSPPVLGVISPATPVGTTAGTIQKHVYTFAHSNLQSGDAVAVTIAGPSSSQSPESNTMDIQKARVVVRYTPKNT